MHALRSRRSILPLVLFLSAIASVAHAQSQFTLQPVITGLTSPVFMTSANDGTGRLFIVQQNGVIKVLQPGSSTPTDFLMISSRVVFGGEEGLLGLAFHPQFRTNRRFFVYYTRRQPVNDGAIQIAEYQANATNPNIADTTEKIIITIPHPTNTNHNGGTVVFGSDGYLYAGTGDGGSGNDPPNNAQNITVLLGKIIRLDIDNIPQGQTYGIPPTNPYAGATPGADEIYAIGMRNPYRFSFDTKLPGRKGRSPGPWPLWVADVGQGAFEEVDTIQLGGNYGWRAYEGFHCTNLNPTQCSTTDPPANPLVQSPPIFEYTHAAGRCSITGGYVYRGRRGTFANGSYIYGDYCTGQIFAYNNDPASQPHQILTTGRSMDLSGFGQDDQGELYVIGLGGTIEKIVRSAGGKPENGVTVRRGGRR